MPSRILLIDDEEYAIEEIADYLRRRGQDVIATSDPAEGLRLISMDRSIDVVITDLKMPEVDGFQIISEAAQQKRQANGAIRIIAMTGHGTEEEERRARMLGADMFLLKPVSMRELMNVLDQRT